MIYALIASGVLFMVAGFCWRISQLHYKLADLNGLIAAMLRSEDLQEASNKAAIYARTHGAENLR